MEEVKHQGQYHGTFHGLQKKFVKIVEKFGWMAAMLGKPEQDPGRKQKRVEKLDCYAMLLVHLSEHMKLAEDEYADEDRKKDIHNMRATLYVLRKQLDVLKVSQR